MITDFEFKKAKEQFDILVKTHKLPKGDAANAAAIMTGIDPKEFIQHIERNTKNFIGNFKFYPLTGKPITAWESMALYEIKIWYSGMRNTCPCFYPSQMREIHKYYRHAEQRYLRRIVEMRKMPDFKDTGYIADLSPYEMIHHERYWYPCFFYFWKKHWYGSKETSCRFADEYEKQLVLMKQIPPRDFEFVLMTRTYPQIFTEYVLDFGKHLLESVRGKCASEEKPQWEDVEMSETVQWDDVSESSGENNFLKFEDGKRYKVGLLTPANKFPCSFKGERLVVGVWNFDEKKIQIMDLKQQVIKTVKMLKSEGTSVEKMCLIIAREGTNKENTKYACSGYAPELPANWAELRQQAQVLIDETKESIKKGKKSTEQDN